VPWARLSSTPPATSGQEWLGRPHRTIRTIVLWIPRRWDDAVKAGSSLQSIVIVAAVACAVIGPSWPNDSGSWLRVIGFVLEAAGAGILIVSRITLGRSFTPMPRPRDRSTLRTTGVYAGARHPIYGGLFILLLGLSFHRSPLVLAPTALLAGIFWLKSIREEAWLAERYPEYDAYRRATPRRFIPWIV
jgi:protein-S-isoprenylcysteine O-methyltransferase Ste14